jgi:hypothetical protein
MFSARRVDLTAPVVIGRVLRCGDARELAVAPAVWISEKKLIK